MFLPWTSIDVSFLAPGPVRRARCYSLLFAATRCESRSRLARELYLHETVDIVGQGAVPYLEQSVVGFDANAIADRGLTLYGTWYVQGSTGRWPQVINVWELVDGWEGWRRLCARTNLQREANPELSAWWKQAASWRSRGFDRLLGAGPGSRTLADVTSDGVKGELFVHELARVRPGAALDYLAAIDEEWAPVMAEHGHRLVGAWEVLQGEGETCLLWATNLDAHIELARATDAARGFPSPSAVADERIPAWRKRACSLREHWREEVLIPCPGSPMGPATWASDSPTP
jgi:hypothetical protein